MTAWHTTTILSRLLVSCLGGAVLLGVTACDQASDGSAISQEYRGSDHADHQMALAEVDDSTLDAIAAPQTDQTLPYFDSEEFTPKWLSPGSSELENFHHIPDFQFTNQSGETVSSASYDDTIYVATFFFATCPGICSPVNHRLMSVQDAIADWDDVRILSHSITPDVDTVDALAAYATKNEINGSTWDLVTGDRSEIYRVAKDGYFASDDLGEGESEGDFKHTENVLLIDRNGMIRGVYNGLSRGAMLNIIADINLLRKEQPPT